MLDEILEQLAATPRSLAHLVAEAPDAALDAPGAESSARITLARARDAEFLVFRLALERILAEPEPALALTLPDTWLIDRNRTRDRKELLLADFALQRQATLGIARMLTPVECARTGVDGDGVVTLDELLTRLVRHDRTTIRAIETHVGETLSQVLERRARRE